MIHKLGSRLFSMTILCVLVFTFIPVHAQDPTIQLWGIWKAPYATLAFYPDSYLYLPMEGNASGSYQVVGDTIVFSGTFQYEKKLSMNDAAHFRIEGNMLYLPDIGFGDKVYERWSGYDAGSVTQCEGAIPTQMKVGYIGRVTITDDHKPTNVRRQPSTKGEKIAAFHDNLYFAVVDGPVCADGYTWFQIRPLYEFEGYIGWVAEGKDYYFIEPAPQMLEALKGAPVVKGVDLSYSCEGTFPTNLYIDAIARVTFLSGLSPLQVYTEPTQTSQDGGRIAEGELVHIDDGPVCAEGAIWWKISDVTGYVLGWVPEVTGSPTHFIERVTVDPNDTTAKFDVLLAASPINNHVMAQIPYKLYASANTSMVVGSLHPNEAYEIVGTNADLSMLQVAVNGQQFWACNSDNYLVFAQRLLPNAIRVTDNSSYQCTDSERSFTPEELFVQAGATVYQPGQYPHQEALKQSISGTPIASMLSDMSGYMLFVKDVVTNDASGMDVICAAINLWSMGSTANSAFPEPDGDASFMCLVLDYGKNILVGEPVSGTMFIMAEILANPDKYIDPWLDNVNQWTDSMPLTRTFCHFKPDICASGPGSQ